MLLGGGGPTAEPVESLEHGPCDGAVIRFEAGEEIGLAVQVFGDRVRLRAGDGLWGKPLDFFSGSLSTGMSPDAEDRINRAILTLEANRR